MFIYINFNLRKRFKNEETNIKTNENDDEHFDDILESIYIEKLLSILSICHSSLDSLPSIPLNSSTKFLAASITSTNQYSSFIHKTIHLNINDLISVDDINNLIIYSNYLSNQTQIPSIQCTYDQRQSLNNTMGICSINLSSQCQITCSNPNATSPEILIQSNNNLQTTITSLSRRLRSPPWS
ncbi:unnamed protein product [Rotaria sordida]|uniref:Uncharacterized protein n=1 Tax=Rotaria sordida TaxID=392033 RepID=A0A815MJI7_9BILA|nr:unnamed protein product [Rotaria sordida]CAF1423528.1 unnamed protein product [Rotaria sordida]